MTKWINVAMLLSTDISDVDSGATVLRMLEPDMLPEKYDNEEPIRHTYDPNNPREALELWPEPGGFLWTRRRKPKLLGIASKGDRESYKVHDSIEIILKAPKQYNHERIKKLFREVDKAFGIVFAYAHTAVPQDTEDLKFYGRHIQRFSQGLSTHRLREGLPGLTWVTLFGEPYKSLFGEKLNAVPAYQIEEIGNTTCIQLTESPQDVADDYAGYMEARAKAIAHLDSGAFTTLEADAPNIPKFPGLDD